MDVVTEMIMENRNSNLFMIVCPFEFANVAKRLPAECFYTFLYIGRIGACVYYMNLLYNIEGHLFQCPQKRSNSFFIIWSIDI